MRTNMLHSNLLGRLGNGLLKFVVLVVMVCNMNGVYADIWSEGGTFNSSQSISSNITIPAGKEVIIKGDLNISGGATLTINGKLKVEGDVTTTKTTWFNTTYGNITVSKDATLHIAKDLTIAVNSIVHLHNKSTLVVERNLTQDGALDLSRNVGDLNANGATIVVGGNYTVDISVLGVDNGSNYPNASKNSIYIFGENNLNRISGTNSNQIKNESAFINDYGSISSFLPIELTSFTATATDYGFAFNWVTASEVENDYFTLEYSIDGVDFNEIDYVHGAGTTSETSEYEYRWDEAPEFDVVYFRLKQTDYNGEYSYSDVIVASRKKSSGANGTFRYGPLNLQIQDGELRYIVK